MSFFCFWNFHNNLRCRLSCVRKAWKLQQARLGNKEKLGVKNTNATIEASRMMISAIFIHSIVI
jgi:hypothetical protein